MPRLLAALFLFAIYDSLDAQPCPEQTYHKTYRIANGDVEVNNADALICPGDVLYTVGLTYLSKNSSEFGSIQKYDNTGDLMWHKAYISGHESTVSWTGFNKVISTGDNNLMVSGIASVDFYHSNPILQKTDLNGNPIWAKIFPAFDIYTELAVATLPDGGFAYTCGPMMVGKLDKDGIPVWTKSFQYAGNAPAINAVGNIIYGDGALYLSLGVGGGNTYRSTHFLKLDPANGTVIWEKKIDNPNYSINFTQILLRNNMLYLPYQVDSNFQLNTRTNGRIKMDENGNVRDIIHFAVPFAGPIWMKFSRNDPFVASVYNEGLNEIGLIRIPEEGYVQWAHNYDVPAYGISMVSIADLSSGSYLALSNYFLNTDYGSSTWLTRVNSAGEMPNCSTDDNISVGIQHISLPIINDDLQNSDITPDIQPYRLTTSDLSPVEATICSGQDLCNAITVSPHADVCGLGDTLTFTANKENGCTLAVNWNYDTSAATVISSGTSSIDLVLHKPGTFQLTGSLQTSCQLVSDRTDLKAYDSPKGIELGPDRVLCEGSLDTLHAGKGFMSYLWQDGSSDSVYHVSSPGNYTVTATSFCNEPFTAAIRFLPPAIVAFELGPDITICPGDSATLIPPSGFSGYSWSPVYHESTTAFPSLSVYPDQDTSYTCTALTMQGCPVTDSIRVLLAAVKPIDLDGAISICPNGQTTLDAGSGFTSYLWTSGETTQQITVSQPAQYSVKATNANNCKSEASVTLSWYKVVKPALGPDISLCTVSAPVLDAGPDYVRYLWQDGSTNARLVVSQPGDYWVQVTDSNGCSAADTVGVMAKTHCRLGIFFPNAITPNGDGKNDVFKPILYGSLDVYHLAIYDRYGEIVFESNDPAKGWDGRYKNTSMATNTFVWYATYHFSGSSEPANMQKGTVEVIR
jgi:gliding motility-associated-like protein